MASEQLGVAQEAPAKEMDVEILRAETQPVSDVMPSAYMMATSRSSLDYVTYKLSHGLMGVDPDFALPDPATDWAAAYIMFVTNAWRMHLSDMFHALEGLEASMSTGNVRASTLKNLFKWLEDASEFFTDSLDFTNFVLEPIISDRIVVQRTTGSGRASAMMSAVAAPDAREDLERIGELFCSLSEERDELASKLTLIKSMKKSVGLVRDDRVIPELIKRGTVFIVHALGHVAREEDSYAPLLREYFGSWEVQQLVDAKRIFYEKLATRNSYLRMVARCMLWQNREERARSSHLYLNTLKHRILFPVANSQIHSGRELLFKLFEASIVPRRSKLDPSLSRAGSSIATDRSDSASVIRGLSVGRGVTTRKSLDMQYEEIKHLQGETERRASLDVTLNNLYSVSKLYTDRVETIESDAGKNAAGGAALGTAPSHPFSEMKSTLEAAMVVDETAAEPSAERGTKTRANGATTGVHFAQTSGEERAQPVKPTSVAYVAPPASKGRDLPTLEFEDIEDSEEIQREKEFSPQLPFSIRVSDAIA